MVNQTEHELQVGLRSGARAADAAAASAEASLPGVGRKRAQHSLHSTLFLSRGETVGVPMSELSGALLLRPSDSYAWPDDGSILWLGRLLSVPRSRHLARTWQRVRRTFDLSESEVLLDYLPVKQTHPSARGTLYITSTQFCFLGRHARVACGRPSVREVVPLAAVIALEKPRARELVVRWGTADEPRELLLTVKRHPHKAARLLERHINRHTPGLALQSAADEAQQAKFGLPAEERILHDFGCLYSVRLKGQPPRLVRGRLCVFSGYICFAAKPPTFNGVYKAIKTETIVCIPLAKDSGVRTVVNMERQASCRAIASAIIVSTLEQQHTFSGFAQPDRALEAMHEAWQEAQPDLDKKRPSEPDKQTHENARGQFEEEAVTQQPRYVRCDLQSSSQSLLSRAAFHCCVRVDRLSMPGVRRADSTVQPLRLTVQAPLTMRNTLPLDLAFTIVTAEVGGETGSGHPGFPEREAVALSPPSPAQGRLSLRLRSTARVNFARNSAFRKRSTLGSASHSRSTCGSNASADSIATDGAALSGAAPRGALRRKGTVKMLVEKGKQVTSSELVVRNKRKIKRTYRFTRAAIQRKASSLGAARNSLPAAAGTLDAGGMVQLHSVCPMSQWQLMVQLDGYEPSSAVLLNRGDGFDHSILLAKLDDVIELKPVDVRKRALRIHVKNVLRPGGGRDVHFYAPYWLVNQSDLPLEFREVRLGINTKVGASATHKMNGEGPPSTRDAGEVRESADSTAAASLRSRESASAERESASGREESTPAEPAPRRPAMRTQPGEASGLLRVLAEGRESLGESPTVDETVASLSRGDSRKLEHAFSTLRDPSLRGDHAVLAPHSRQVSVEFSHTAFNDLEMEKSAPALATIGNVSSRPDPLADLETGSSSEVHSDRGLSDSIASPRTRADSAEGHSEGETVEAGFSSLPVLFSYSKHDLFVNRLSVRVAGVSGWSKVFSTEVLSTTGALRVGPYEIGIGVEAADPPADFTKVVTFAPRYVLLNTLPCSLSYRQVGAAEAVSSLHPGAEAPFHWANFKGEHLLQLAVSEQARYLSRFSGGFRIDEVSELLVRCGVTESAFDVVYENQRRSTPSHDFSIASLLPTDACGAWCSLAGADSASPTRLRGLPDDPPARWEWADHEWHCEAPAAEAPGPGPQTDADGWEYAVHWDVPWQPAPFELALVRRRRWTRRRVPKQLDEFDRDVDERFLAVDISLRGPSVLVTVSDGAARPPPYVIECNCAVPLVFGQKGVPNSRRLIGPGERLPYTWDEPSGKRVLELRGSTDKRRASISSAPKLVEVRLDEVGERPAVRWGNQRLWVQVSVRGSTRRLELTDYGEQSKVLPEEMYLHLTAQLKGIGISLVRSGLRELAYACIFDLALELSASSLNHRAALTVGDFRVDNQAIDAQLPAVIIRSSAVTRQHTLMQSESMRSEELPFLQVTVVKKTARGVIGDEVRDSHSRLTGSVRNESSVGAADPVGGSLRASAGVPSARTHAEEALVFPYAAVLIDEMELRVEEDFIHSVIGFVSQLRFAAPPPPGGADDADDDACGASSAASRTPEARKTLRDTSMREGLAWPLAEPAPLPRCAESVSWYFQKLKLSPIKVNLTYVHGQHLLNEIFRNPVIVPNLDRAPLVLNGLTLEHTFKTPQQLCESILSSYKSAMLKQVYKLLLQIDALGNPAGFVRGLGAGVKDFFLMPGEALFNDPHRLGRGVVNGTYSLTRSVVHGTFKASSQITGGLGRLAGTLSMDSRYVQARQQQQQAPRHVLAGMVQGSASLGRGVMDGLTGLISAPIEGAQSDGFSGLIKGIGLGVVGAFVKPTAGMLDAMTRTAEGIANTFDYLEEVGAAAPGDGPVSEQRVRPPRMMHGAEHALRPYSRSEATAQRVLLGLHEGSHMHEALRMCVRLTASEVLVLTEARLLVASATTFKVTRQYPLLVVQSVRTRADMCGVEVQLKQGFNRAMTGRPSSERRSLVGRLSVAGRPLDGLAEADQDEEVAAKSSEGKLSEKSSELELHDRQISVHRGRVTRYGSWRVGSKKAAEKAAKERASAAMPRTKAEIAAAAADTYYSTVTTLGPHGPIHEIACTDQKTCRAVVAALTLALSPGGAPEQDAEQSRRGSRSSRHRASSVTTGRQSASDKTTEAPTSRRPRPLLVTSSNLRSTLREMETAAFKVATGSAEGAACHSSAGAVVDEAGQAEGRRGSRPDSFRQRLSLFSPSTPVGSPPFGRRGSGNNKDRGACSQPASPSVSLPASPRERSSLLGTRGERWERWGSGHVDGRTEVESDTKNFELSHRISRRLRTEMSEMPAPRSCLMPELPSSPPRQPKRGLSVKLLPSRKSSNSFS